jgi:hypothetical protein
MTRQFTMTLKAAQESARISLGNSKMPGTTFAQDSFACKVGDKLAKVDGSVCSKCYARKIQRLRPSVNIGWKANLEKARHWLQVNPKQWVDSCVFQINRAANKSGENYHRWFDSGDLDSVDQLAAICKVAELTPNIAHWLPTREAGVVKQFINQGGIIPKNLVIRVSATMIDDSPVKGYATTSTVHSKGKPHHGHACPAPYQGNSCGEGEKACRACWNPNVQNISYVKH